MHMLVHMVLNQWTRQPKCAHRVQDAPLIIYFEHCTCLSVHILKICQFVEFIFKYSYSNKQLLYVYQQDLRFSYALS